jgi:hypothetical protein
MDINPTDIALKAALEELRINPELHARNRFAHDVVAKYHRFGSLSAAQVKALTESLARDREATDPKAAAPEGRVTVTGTVLSLKDQTNKFTGRMESKMLVKLDTGAKVYAGALPGVNKGDTVTFTATFKRSKDDPSFAFGDKTVGLAPGAPEHPGHVPPFAGATEPWPGEVGAPKAKAPKAAKPVTLPPPVAEPDGPSALEELLAELG